MKIRKGIIEKFDPEKNAIVNSIMVTLPDGILTTEVEYKNLDLVFYHDQLCLHCIINGKDYYMPLTSIHEIKRRTDQYNDDKKVVNKLG